MPPIFAPDHNLIKMPFVRRHPISPADLGGNLMPEAVDSVTDYHRNTRIKQVTGVNGGAKSSHGAEQKSASLGVTGALANALPT